MTTEIEVISPADGRVYATRPLAEAAQIEAALAAAQAAQPTWAALPVAGRAALVNKAVDHMVAHGAEIAEELSWQMGRPVAQTPNEVRGLEERARYMADIAESALADVDAGPKAGFHRYVRRAPLGVVLVVAPWNYPYLTAVNAVVPALLAGNAVILKASHQTPLSAERFAAAFEAAGMPAGVFRQLHMSRADTERVVADPRIDFVNFTGSVAGGRAIQHAARDRFIGLGLELGGKDPAYVRADANLPHAVENLVDGAFFNSGQSCCGIERIYAHRDVYQPFVDGFVELTNRYRLGDPLDPETNLGPVVRASAAGFVRGQVDDAVAAGARALIDEAGFPGSRPDTPYLAPQVVVDVDHDMRLMREESFGPVVAIMPVDSDEQAIGLMNDCDYGLTAAVWTEDEAAAVRIGDRIDTGTWFMNRCDYLDPALAWTGVKDSGHGCSLSRVGFEQLTRPKSYHLRIET